MIITILLEAMLSLGYIKVYKVVDNDYNHSVFTAIITLSTICFTIISIIISVAGNRVNEIKLSEIIKLKSFPFDISEMVVLYLSLDCVSIVALTNRFVMMLTMTLVMDILASSYYAGWLLYYISDEEKLKQVIKDEVCTNPKIFKDKFLSEWIVGLKNSLLSKNEIKTKEYVDLLKEVIVDKDCANQFNSNLPELFSISCDSIGITESIELINTIYSNKEHYFYDDTIRDYFNELKLRDERVFLNFKIAGTINSITESDVIEDYLKTDILFWIFDCIYGNVAINEKYKFDLINNYINTLLKLYDKHNWGEIRVNTALYIVKYYVLLNENNDYAKRIFKIFTKALLTNKAYSHQKSYIKLVASTLRAFYFYIYIDGSVSRNQKKGLKNIFESQQNTIEGIRIEFNRLVANNSKEIIEYLMYSAIFDKEYKDIMDNISPLLGIREVVWSKENKMSFVLCLYVIFGYKYKAFPILDYLNKKEITKEQADLLRKLSNLYDYNTNSLVQDIQQRINDLTELLDVKKMYGEFYIDESFEIINDTLKDIDYNCLQTIDVDERLVLKNISEYIGDRIQGFQIGSSEEVKNTETFYINPLIVKTDDYFIKSVSNNIARAILEGINIKLEDSLVPVKLTFDKDGLLKLQSWLKRDEIKYGNYRFIDDFAFKSDIRNSTEYIELSEVLNDVNIVNTREIDCRFFIKELELTAFYNIVEIKYEKLTLESANEYIAQYMTSENHYKLNSVLYDREGALDFVIKHYRVLNATIEIGLNIDKGSGFRIKYR